MYLSRVLKSSAFVERYIHSFFVQHTYVLVPECYILYMHTSLLYVCTMHSLTRVEGQSCQPGYVNAPRGRQKYARLWMLLGVHSECTALRHEPRIPALDVTIRQAREIDFIEKIVQVLLYAALFMAVTEKSHFLVKKFLVDIFLLRSTVVQSLCQKLKDG